MAEIPTTHIRVRSSIPDSSSQLQHPDSADPGRQQMMAKVSASMLPPGRPGLHSQCHTLALAQPQLFGDI